VTPAIPQPPVEDKWVGSSCSTWPATAAPRPTLNATTSSGVGVPSLHQAERKQPPNWKRCNATTSALTCASWAAGSRPRAVQLRFSALRTFYRFLVRHDSLQLRHSKPRLAQSGQAAAKFLTPKQMEDLLVAPLKLLPQRQNRGQRQAATIACRRDVAILETIYSCGLRISELCGWSRRTSTGASAAPRAREGQEGRLLPVGEAALEAIQNYWGCCRSLPRANPRLPHQPKKRTPVAPTLLQLRLKKYLAVAASTAPDSA